jgi:LuxR family maltose regulon positive regulatory protein
MNNVDAAFRFLQEAYETALPNDIVMPFIELGKDMRTLVDLAADCPECPIPHPWLKSIRQRASAYSRNQALIISGHKKTHGIVGKIALSPRETVILHDLRDGLSRSEIAAKHTISINTVKLHINSMYNKLGARNRADMFRIAVENNIL